MLLTGFNLDLQVFTSVSAWWWHSITQSRCSSIWWIHSVCVCSLEVSRSDPFRLWTV